MARFKFKVLASTHQQADPDWEPSEEDKEFAKATGKKPKAPTRTYSAGDVVETDTDLVAKLGDNKFQLLEDREQNKPRKDQPPGQGAPDFFSPTRTPQDVAEKPSPPPPPKKDLPANLERMDQKQLQKFAEEEEIDLGNSKDKNEILAKIRQAHKVRG